MIGGTDIQLLEAPTAEQVLKCIKRLWPGVIQRGSIGARVTERVYYQDAIALTEWGTLDAPEKPHDTAVHVFWSSHGEVWMVANNNDSAIAKALQRFQPSDITYRCGAKRTRGCGAVITIRTNRKGYDTNGISCPVCGTCRLATRVEQ